MVIADIWRHLLSLNYYWDQIERKNRNTVIELLYQRSSIVDQLATGHYFGFGQFGIFFSHL